MLLPALSNSVVCFKSKWRDIFLFVNFRRFNKNFLGYVYILISILFWVYDQIMNSLKFCEFILSYLCDLWFTKRLLLRSASWLIHLLNYIWNRQAPWAYGTSLRLIRVFIATSYSVSFVLRKFNWHCNNISNINDNYK